MSSSGRKYCSRNSVSETLIITGINDKVVPMQNSVNLSNLIPNSKLKIIENGSHLFFIEQAKEFNEIITNFLK